jgi:hypothetical protein
VALLLVCDYIRKYRPRFVGVHPLEISIDMKIFDKAARVVVAFGSTPNSLIERQSLHRVAAVTTLLQAYESKTLQISHLVILHIT